MEWHLLAPVILFKRSEKNIKRPIKNAWAFQPRLLAGSVAYLPAKTSRAPVQLLLAYITYYPTASSQFFPDQRNDDRKTGGKSGGIGTVFPAPTYLGGQSQKNWVGVRGLLIKTYLWPKSAVFSTGSMYDLKKYLIPEKHTQFKTRVEPY